VHLVYEKCKPPVHIRNDTNDSVVNRKYGRMFSRIPSVIKSRNLLMPPMII